MWRSDEEERRYEEKGKMVNKDYCDGSRVYCYTIRM